jgi:hypothetical protein
VGQLWLGSERDALGTAGLALNGWSHLASTYDGSTLRLYVNGVLVSSTAASGSLAASSGVLRIGGNGVWPEWFAGLIDEVRVYNRALSAAEIQSDMNTAVGTTADTTPPTVPGNVRVNSSTGTINVFWDASTDNVGVARYDVYRSTSSGFVPSSSNRIGQPTGTSFADMGLPAGTYYYVVKAEDATGNLSAASNQVSGVAPDMIAPTVSVSAPVGGSSVAGVVGLSASASDDVGVVGVQFRVDGVNVGAEVSGPSPYSGSWDSRLVADGSHVVSAVARDAAGNTGSSSVSVTVSNAAPPPPPPPPSGLVAAWGFNEGAGMSVADASGKGHVGTVSSTSWSTSGKFGGALSFNGSSSWVTVADANDLDLSSALTLEAWVRPSVLGSGWRTVVFKERSGGMVYSLYANQSAGRPVGQVWLGAEQNAVGSAGLALNAWSHLASTYDGSMLRLYVNGVLVSSSAVSGSMAASSGVLRIGGNGVWPEWFAGLIDEVRVYNRALSASEIQTDMSTAVG